MIQGFLKKQIESGSLLHAYLINAAAGSGKNELAENMAMSIVCSGSGKKPCLNCPDCRKAKLGIHPDIIRVKRLPDKREILVDQIREIVSGAAVLPNDAARKAYIIDEADLMNQNAQNALLKVLEEPPSFVTFILLSENPGAIIETIHSRCIEINLHPGEDAIEPESDKSAVEFMDVLLNGSSFDLVKFMFNAEKLERPDFERFVDDTAKLSIIRAKDAVLSGNDAEIYLKTAEIFTSARKYFKFNVNTGHISGLITAELQSGLKQK